jgi:translocation and assembly module TamA
VALAGSPPGAPPPTPEQLAAMPAPVALEIRPEPGRRYTLRSITTEGAAPILLQPGEPARAETVLAAETAALAGWRSEGRPLAQVSRRVTVDHGAGAMDVVFVAAPGPRARFAPPTVQGTVAVNPEVAQRIAAIRLASWYYTPELVAQARADLLALGPFGSVRAEQATALDAEGRLPVNFHLTERPFRAVTATVAYETNFGAAVSLAWEHRNLFGGAERFRIEAEVSRLGESFERTNARLSASYRQPFPLGYPGTLIVNTAILRERLDSYDRDAVTASILYEQRFGRYWTLGAGPTAEIGRTGLPGEALRPSNLVGFATQARFDNTNSRLDPTRGYRLRLDVTPSYSLSRSKAYVPVRATASTYIDLQGEGRTVLALRGSVGSLLNAQAEDVPVAQRFFAGGGGSVRGYGFQTIGPRDARGRPRGGASVLEGSIELRQRFGTSFGGVAFVDAGGVGVEPFTPTDALRVGAGVGVRYYTAFGPVRADVAVPLVRQQGSNSFGLYIGIGHAF